MIERIVTSDNATEYMKHQFVIEASTLQIPVGTIFGSLLTDLGNKKPFVRTNIRPDGSVDYKQLGGCITLVVLND